MRFQGSKTCFSGPGTFFKVFLGEKNSKNFRFFDPGPGPVLEGLGPPETINDPKTHKNVKFGIQDHHHWIKVGGSAYFKG